MLRITNRETVFFDHFAAMLGMALEASKALEDLIVDYTDVEKKIDNIGNIEHECDLQVHTVLKKLNVAFITPIDREDIYLITKELDNIVDNIEKTADLFIIYNIKEIKPVTLEIVKLITESIIHLQKLVDELVRLKTSKIIHNEIIEVNKIENQGDTIYKNELTRLFGDETDAVDIIRWHGIFDNLESALDACEDVADIIEGVVMKNA
jgi:Phosphate transport regulator (distant homolog of PhoU)